MTTLAKQTPRKYLLGDYDRLQIIADDKVFEGAAVGDNASGYARPLVAADPFLGFATETKDNTGGAAGDKRVTVLRKGIVRLTVVGATGVADIGEDVYALDDNSFTLTASGASAIGTVVQHVTGTTVDVYFESVAVRSI